MAVIVLMIPLICPGVRTCMTSYAYFQIGNLKTIYRFQLVINETFRQDCEYHFLASRHDGQWSEIGEMYSITQSLREEMLGMVSLLATLCFVAHSTIHNNARYHRH